MQICLNKRYSDIYYWTKQVPLRVPVNKNWTAGLLQLEGYCLGHYYNYSSPGQNRFTALGIDDQGFAHAAL